MNCDVCAAGDHDAAALRSAGCSAADVQAWCTGGGAAPPVAILGQLNAKDFGAVGDGQADDAPALQRAINAALESGQTLTVPVRSRSFALTFRSTFYHPPMAVATAV
jgi:hypothetical protein